MARALFLFFIFLITLKVSQVMGAANHCGPIVADNIDWIQFALNLEFLEAEFFLHGALGRGLDTIAPTFANGGPRPVGAKKVNLDPLIGQIIEEFGYQGVGHIRGIITTIGGIPRPLLDLSPQNFAKLFDEAVGFKLSPPFDPYLDSVHCLLASYVIPYVGLVGYVGIVPNLNFQQNFFKSSKADIWAAQDQLEQLVASLLGVETGQDAVIRTLLYERANQKVLPYNMTVAEFTNRISGLRNKLGMCGNKDKGIQVPLFLGAEHLTNSNILSADSNSLSYARTPPEILRIIYGSGSEYKSGGFYPNGAGGNIAMSFLHKA